MKSIEIDEELYHYIASQTQHIGESASQILRRLLDVDLNESSSQLPQQSAQDCLEKLHAFTNSEEYQEIGSSVGRFIALLSCLYQSDPQAFTHASEIKGSKRVYFATSEQELLATGKTTNPKAIPQSPFWVITNTNTGRKRLILSQLMDSMGYGKNDIESVVSTI
ncbi:replication initiation negative regulator SeqA [Celerinatantimonas sp. MCCC 1A17872]|uniref:replication initiation negative regulator SeqA n=1 Tax=Celerinatantimonas sp. MCCC 1A17872 TaxID=3177514 RepID=UPI0038C9D8D0